MQLILLSGGSGKRLWPLSNDTRSKQFLRLLRRPDGGAESMVQRLLRQIREAGLSGGVTIATSESQRDALTCQVGSSVRVVTEPERRDTFPSILLASASLLFERGCSRDEVVVVIPCDSFTGLGYFQAISRMARAAEEGVADLILMGIRPTSPSDELGYILPDSHSEGEEVRSVCSFVEKPDQLTAEELIRRGAYWNGGVFAFRLGYMANLMERYLSVGSVAEFKAQYGRLPMISFDYEVAEKAQSLAMVPYAGPWKDLGTWRTLVEEIPEPVIGNAKLDKSCSNTHIINELGQPILCLGVSNMIVAASPDGILVCDKTISKELKPKVESLALRTMYEERRWGTYRVLDHTHYPDGHQSLTKHLHLHAGCSISYQTHACREEVWTFINGEGLLALEGKITRVGRGSVAHIRRGEHHAVKAITDLEIIEVQSGDRLIEEDIERYDWNWEE